MNIEDYNYLTYEKRGYQYYGHYVVHGWSVYDENSVLAGQEMKCFLDSFETIEEVHKAYPTAESSHPFLQAVNTFDHLPDDGDY